MGQANVQVISSKKNPEKSSPTNTPKEKEEKNYPGREDGGPSTRSKTAQENAELKSYTDKVKSQTLIKASPKQVVYIHEIKEFVESQKINFQFTPKNEALKKRQAQAKCTKQDIIKLNIDQWTSLKESGKQEKIKWKNSLVRNKWCNIGTYWKLDKLGLPRQQEGIEQPIWVQTKENSWKH